MYRGKVVRADRDGGVRTRFIYGDDYEFNLSFGGAFPVSSENNKARIGLPNLDWMFQVGPQYLRKLKNERRYSIRLGIPIRSVFSTDFKMIQYHGFVFDPHLSLRVYDFPYKDARLSVSMSSVFGDRRINEYFYGVRSQYVLPNRAFYKAESGYIGTSLFISQSIPHKWGKVFSTVGLNSYNFSANKESPLFKTEFAYYFSAGFMVTLYRSKRKSFEAKKNHIE